MMSSNVKKYTLLNTLGSKQSLEIKFGQFVTFQKKAFCQIILQKLRPEIKFQVLLCLQRIRHNLYWKWNFWSKLLILDM